MNLVEKIPDLEQDMIERYIYDYAVRDDDYLKGSFAGVDYVLRHWSAAKSQYLYKLFGEQLILKKKISYDKDSYKIRSEIYDFMWNSYGIGNKFVNAFSSPSLKNPASALTVPSPNCWVRYSVCPE